MPPEKGIQHELALQANRSFGKKTPGKLTTKDLASLPTEDWRLRDFNGPPDGWKEFVEALKPNHLSLIKSMQYHLSRTRQEFTIEEIRKGVSRERRVRAQIGIDLMTFLETTFTSQSHS